MRSTYTKPSDIDRDIDKLIQEFENTQVRQNDIIRKIKRKVQLRDELRESQGPPPIPVGYSVDVDKGTIPELPYTETFQPLIGDEVRILNPREGQRTKGTVQGFCKDGKARVKVGPTHKLIDRSWKNIVCTKRAVQVNQDGGEGSSKRRYQSR